VAQLCVLALLWTGCGDEQGAATESDKVSDSGTMQHDDPCRSQCPLNTEGPCKEKPFESFPALDVTFKEWSNARCVGGGSFPFLLEAKCQDGTRVLYYGTGVAIERRYYDASGQFLGLETAGDGGQGPTCNDSAYWPVRVECEDAKATKVVCGDQFKVGEPVAL
jgi:hypothetical protein